jgi:hypothetical protein
MLAKFRPRLTFANVTSLLALFVALGGSAYATGAIGPSDIQKDAVRSKHIKDGAVQNQDLAAKSVGTGKVIDNSLIGADIKDGSVGGRRIADDSISDADVGLAAATSDNAPPETDPNLLVDAIQVTTAAGGRLFAVGQAQLSLGCDVTSNFTCIFDFGLYVDGNPVPGSLRTIPVAKNSSGGGEIVFTGISNPVVGPGPHTVAISGKQTNENAVQDGSTFGLRGITAVAIGG